MAKAEIAFLAEQFRPFEVTELQIASDFPDAHSLAIVMKDPSGRLEALHCELVHRVYRRAIASNYSLGLAKVARDRDTKRARLMIELYRAPYILQRYQPHFTLLTQVPDGERAQVAEELESAFSENVERRTVRIERLAIMVRPSPGAPWEIEREVKLGRNY